MYFSLLFACYIYHILEQRTGRPRYSDGETPMFGRGNPVSTMRIFGRGDPDIRTGRPRYSDGETPIFGRGDPVPTIEILDRISDFIFFIFIPFVSYSVVSIFFDFLYL